MQRNGDLFIRMEAKQRITESRRWARAGAEPSTTELLADPIALLLMRADRLTVNDVEAVLRAAKRRPYAAPSGFTPTM
jgi:hypothetical protein